MTTRPRGSEQIEPEEAGPPRRAHGARTISTLCILGVVAVSVGIGVYESEYTKTTRDVGFIVFWAGVVVLVLCILMLTADVDSPREFGRHKR